ncbi:hypothetical protein KV580_19535 [Pseudomonas chlororaphis]|nr:hypothetical protein [Pseudomonas chlororaphis]
MAAIRFRYRQLWLISLVIFLSACATHPEIPAPTAPAPYTRQLDEADGITAPPQKAWQWDSNRWFTAELDHRCIGPIRFVDERNGIDTYVGRSQVPRITFSSDDPDVVLAIVAGGYEQLVFSTDGGRHFVQEVRGFPQGQITQFVMVRKGHVYVGMELLGQHPDGYFKWRHPGFRPPWQTAPPAVEEHQLVILEAPLDKVKNRIGWYSVVAPKDYQFRSEYVDQAQQDIKRIDTIESLGLPHMTDAAPSDACERTLKLPPWSSMMDKEELLQFYDWYATMKATHPGWADAQTDKFIAWHRNWHRAVLIPGAETPRR